MFGTSLTKLLLYSWVVVLACCFPMWVFNADYGEEHMHGWLFQQGTWAWGCAVTWHIVDVGYIYAPCAPKYYWVAHLWKWSEHAAAWEGNFLLSDGRVQGADVEPWMVHKLHDEEL